MHDLKTGSDAFEAAPFKPHWLLRSRHVQTVFATLGRNEPDPPSQHALVATPDGDALDVYYDAESDRDPSRPIVLIAHGMEGSHRSPYVRRLRDNVRAEGWHSMAMVHRSCGRRLNATRRLYHAGEAEDLATVVDWIVERWPGRRFFVAGYSLSAGQVARWLGAGRHSIPESLGAAAAISPPFDLTQSVPEIDRALAGVYRRSFLRRLIPKALAKARQHPGSLDEMKVRAIRTLHDFDDAVVAALHGFRDADDYHRTGSCAQFLHNVQRPLLLIASEDDPFSPERTIPRHTCADNPFLHTLFTARGGHCGFVAGTVRTPIFWAEQQVVRFFATHV
jgi:predicted alpha/beta-fold hydrolase